MVKFEIYLRDEDFDRLLAIKDLQEHKNDLSAQDFAKELLENAIYQKHPAPVIYNDETGDIVK